MKHSDYWRGRFEQLNEALLKQGLDYYDELEKSYRKAARDLEKDITVWYQRLAANNGISYAEAKRLLTANERKEFRWTVEEYIEHGKKNSTDQQWLKQLENASAKVHISRLEALKLQTQQHLEVLYGNQLDGIDKTMRGIYEGGYYKSAFEVQRGLNVGYSFQRLDENWLNKVVAKPWAADGKNFSDRIWQDKNKLLNTLHAELTYATIRGDSPGQTVKAVSDKLNVARNTAGRLVMTESAFFASASQRDCFGELGVEEYEIVATLDSKTSSICREMDGKVFKRSEYEPGVTANPFHCWCRSCTAPYFADEKGSRAARGEDGKTYYVPSDMKYDEWEKTFVSGIHPPADTKIDKFQDIYRDWNKVDVKDFANDIVKAEKIPVNVEYHPLSGAHGLCGLDCHHSDMRVISYELNSDDLRSVDYQVKTAFHELYHAKSHSLAHDINAVGLERWCYMDDVFAETTAHYLVKSMGITKEIAPSYAGHLIETLPKLKRMAEFSECVTIADFGKVAYAYRFTEKANAEWGNLLSYLDSQKHDIIEYGKSYIDYIEKNKSELLDKMLEHMPQFAPYKSDMLDDVKNVVRNVRKGQDLKGNELVVYQNLLAIAMNRLGVK